MCGVSEQFSTAVLLDLCVHEWCLGFTLFSFFSFGDDSDMNFEMRVSDIEYICLQSTCFCPCPLSSPPSYKSNKPLFRYGFFVGLLGNKNKNDGLSSLHVCTHVDLTTGEKWKVQAGES